MALVKNLDELDKGSKGDYCFLNDFELIAIRYGDDAFKGLVIIPIAESIMPGKPHWRWDGNKELPTITPSILVHEVPDWNTGWHGFLTNGLLIDA